MNRNSDATRIRTVLTTLQRDPENTDLRLAILRELNGLCKTSETNRNLCARNGALAVLVEAINQPLNPLEVITTGFSLLTVLIDKNDSQMCSDLLNMSIANSVTFHLSENKDRPNVVCILADFITKVITVGGRPCVGVLEPKIFFEVMNIHVDKKEVQLSMVSALYALFTALGKTKIDVLTRSVAQNVLTLCTTLANYGADEEIAFKMYSVLSYVAGISEGIKHTFVENKGFETLVSTLRTNIAKSPRVVCACLATLVNTVVNSEELATLAGRCDIFRNIVIAVESNMNTADVVASGFMALSVLTAESATNKQLGYTSRIHSTVIDGMKKYSNNDIIQETGFEILTNISYKPAARQEIIQHDSLHLATFALRKMSNKPNVLAAALRFISIVVDETKPETEEKIVKEGVKQAIYTTMKKFPNDIRVQQHCCAALRVLFGLNKKNKHSEKKEGLEPILSTIERFSDGSTTVVQEAAFMALASAADSSTEDRAYILSQRFIGTLVQTLLNSGGIVALQVTAMRTLNVFCAGDGLNMSDRMLIMPVLGTMKQQMKCREIQTVGCQILLNLFRVYQCWSIEESLRNSAVSVLINAMRTFPDDLEVTRLVCDALTVLQKNSKNVAAEIVELNGVNILVARMKKIDTTIDTLLSIHECVCELSSSNDDTRFALLRAGVFEIFAVILSSPSLFESGVHVLRCVLRSICNLAECRNKEAITMLVRMNACQLIIEAMTSALDDDEAQAMAARALGNFAIACEQTVDIIFRNGGILSIFNAMRGFAGNERVFRSCAFATQAMCSYSGHKECRAEFARQKIMPLLLDNMRIFANDPTVVKHTIAAIGDLALDDRANSELFLNAHGMDELRDALATSGSTLDITCEYYYMLSKLCHLNEANCQNIGFEEVKKLLDVLHRHSKNQKVVEAGMIALASILEADGRTRIHLANDKLLGAKRLLEDLNNYYEVVPLIRSRVAICFSYLFPGMEGEVRTRAGTDIPNMLDGLTRTENTKALCELLNVLGKSVLNVPEASLYFIKKNGCETIMAVLKDHMDTKFIVQACFFIISSLCEASEECRRRFNQQGLLAVILEAIEKNFTNTATLVRIYLAFVHASIKNPAMCMKFCQDGGLELIKKTIESYPTDVFALKGAIFACSSIIPQYQNAIPEVIDMGIMDLVIKVVNEVTESSDVFEHSFECLSDIALARPDVFSVYLERNVQSMVVVAAKKFPKAPQMIKNTFKLVGTMCANDNEIRAFFGRECVFDCIYNCFCLHPLYPNAMKFALVALTKLCLCEENASYLNAPDWAQMLVEILERDSHNVIVRSHIILAIGRVAVLNKKVAAKMINKNIVKIIIDICKSNSQDADYVRKCFIAIFNLARAYLQYMPDIMGSSGIFAIFELMGQYPENPHILISGLKCISQTIENSKGDRTFMGDEQIISYLSEYISGTKPPAIIAAAFEAISSSAKENEFNVNIFMDRGLTNRFEAFLEPNTSPDVVLNVFRAYSECASASRKFAKRLLVEKHTLSTIVACMKSKLQSAHMQLYGIRIISKLSVLGADANKQLFENGGISALLDAMKAFQDLCDIQECGLTALTAIAADDETHRSKLFELGAPTYIVDSMKENMVSSSVQEKGARAIANLAASKHENAKKIGTEFGSIERCLLAMREYPDVKEVQEFCLLAIANSATRSAEASAAFVENNGTEVLCRALSTTEPSILKNAFFAVAVLCSRSSSETRGKLTVDCTEVVLNTLKANKNVENLQVYGMIFIGCLFTPPCPPLEEAQYISIVQYVIHSLVEFRGIMPIQTDAVKAATKIVESGDKYMRMFFQLGGVKALILSYKHHKVPAFQQRCLSTILTLLKFPDIARESSSEGLSNVLFQSLLASGGVDPKLETIVCDCIERLPLDEHEGLSALERAVAPKSVAVNDFYEKRAAYLALALFTKDNTENRKLVKRSSIPRCICEFFSHNDFRADEKKFDILENALLVVRNLCEDGEDIPEDFKTLNLEASISNLARTFPVKSTKVTLMYIKREVDAMVDFCFSSGFCTASLTPIQVLQATKYCRTCGCRVCMACTGACHKDHELVDDGFNFQHCACKDCKACSISFKVQIDDGEETSFTAPTSVLKTDASLREFLNGKLETPIGEDMKIMLLYKEALLDFCRFEQALKTHQSIKFVVKNADK